MDLKTSKTKKRAFTLIELLVVIAIIALLLSVILPSLRKAKQSAQMVLCRNNLHQWSLAIGTFALENNNEVPLSTTYGVSGDKVTASFPNEMYLDQYNGQFSLGAETRSWQEKMISHEVIGPYLPGFNDMGLRTDRRSEFTSHEENFLLDGVWRCPLAKKREIGITMDQLTASGRSFFRLDYSYIGRADLWADSMFPVLSDRKALVGRQPASGRIMLMDTIFYWQDGDPAERIYWYNHGKNGPSGEGSTAYLKPPRDIIGVNQAFGDGSVKWKKVDSNGRFQSEGFQTRENRHTFMGYNGYLFF
ncbi:MAG: type II secretion system GspH family protein [Phycisphaerae bacterium]|nr:type II secretion system GspH family protein [Phycisphaerae bacterium]